MVQRDNGCSIQDCSHSQGLCKRLAAKEPGKVFIVLASMLQEAMLEVKWSECWTDSFQ